MYLFTTVKTKKVYVSVVYRALTSVPPERVQVTFSFTFRVLHECKFIYLYVNIYINIFIYIVIMLSLLVKLSQLYQRNVHYSKLQC